MKGTFLICILLVCPFGPLPLLSITVSKTSEYKSLLTNKLIIANNYITNSHISSNTVDKISRTKTTLELDDDYFKWIGNTGDETKFDTITIQPNKFVEMDLDKHVVIDGNLTTNKFIIKDKSLSKKILIGQGKHFEPVDMQGDVIISNKNKCLELHKIHALY